MGTDHNRYAGPLDCCRVLLPPHVLSGGNTLRGSGGRMHPADRRASARRNLAFTKHPFPIREERMEGKSEHHIVGNIVAVGITNPHGTDITPGANGVLVER